VNKDDFTANNDKTLKNEQSNRASTRVNDCFRSERFFLIHWNVEELEHWLNSFLPTHY